MLLLRQDLGGALCHWGRFRSSCRWRRRRDATTSLWFLGGLSTVELFIERELRILWQLRRKGRLALPDDPKFYNWYIEVLGGPWNAVVCVHQERKEIPIVRRLPSSRKPRSLILLCVTHWASGEPRNSKSLNRHNLPGSFHRHKKSDISLDHPVKYKLPSVFCDITKYWACPPLYI